MKVFILIYSAPILKRRLTINQNRASRNESFVRAIVGKVTPALRQKSTVVGEKNACLEIALSSDLVQPGVNFFGPLNFPRSNCLLEFFIHRAPGGKVIGAAFVA